MSQQKAIAKAMKLAGVEWVKPAMFAPCDDVSCLLCKKPKGSKNPASLLKAS